MCPEKEEEDHKRTVSKKRKSEVLSRGTRKAGVLGKKRKGGKRIRYATKRSELRKNQNRARAQIGRGGGLEGQLRGAKAVGQAKKEGGKGPRDQGEKKKAVRGVPKGTKSCLQGGDVNPRQRAKRAHKPKKEKQPRPSNMRAECCHFLILEKREWKTVRRINGGEKKTTPRKKTLPLYVLGIGEPEGGLWGP